MQETDFPFEIVVHDDASTDGTAEILKDYASRYPEIVRPVFQTENQFSKSGIYPTIFAYEKCRGKYIAECDGDDYWTDTQKLQRQVDFMEKNPNVVLCHHPYLVSENGVLRPPDRDRPRDFTREQLVGFAISGYGIGSCTRLYRNPYSATTRQDLIDFNGDYPTNVYLGTLGSAKFLADIRPSVYRRNNGTNSWCSLPGPEKARKTKEMQQRIYDHMVKKGNPEWIRLRKAFI
jgi:glycosyltransferase involved in cell wall biosynthesis